MTDKSQTDIQSNNIIPHKCNSQKANQQGLFMEEWRKQQPWAEAMISKFDMFDYWDVLILDLKNCLSTFLNIQTFSQNTDHIQTNFRDIPEKVWCHHCTCSWILSFYICYRDYT